MKFGLSTVTRGVLVARENYMAVAKAAERAGFDFLSVSDHMIVPGSCGLGLSLYAGRGLGGGRTRALLRSAGDAGVPRRLHQRLRLLTSVMVVPHRPGISLRRCWQPSTCSRAAA